jgi:hypothetical protein
MRVCLTWHKSALGARTGSRSPRLCSLTSRRSIFNLQRLSVGATELQSKRCELKHAGYPLPTRRSRMNDSPCDRRPIPQSGARLSVPVAPSAAEASGNPKTKRRDFVYLGKRPRPRATERRTTASATQRKGQRIGASPCRLDTSAPPRRSGTAPGGARHHCVTPPCSLGAARASILLKNVAGAHRLARHQARAGRLCSAVAATAAEGVPCMSSEGRWTDGPVLPVMHVARQ